MTKAAMFDKALKLHQLTKKEFAGKTNIPYDTVTGWKRSNNVPKYAFMLLKKIANDEKRRPKILVKKIKPEITTKLLKQAEVTFWGKNYDIKDVIKKARRGNQKYLSIILTNMWIKDALKIIGPKAILKHIEQIKDKIPKDSYLAYRYIAKSNL
jgi:predicted transcriptional regulator